MRGQRSTGTLPRPPRRWSPFAFTALFLLTGCAGLQLPGFNLPFLRESDPVLDQQSRVEEEFGRPVAIGVGQASGADSNEACRLARLEAINNGLEAIYDAGLEAGKRPYLKDQLITDQQSCFVTVKWPKLSTRSHARRGAGAQSLVISVAPPAAQPATAAAAPEPTPGLRSSAAASAAAAAAAPAPGTTQVQPQVAPTILYFDLRQGEMAEGPRPATVERPLRGSALSATSEFEVREDGEDRNDTAIGVGIIPAVALEVPISIPVRFLAKRMLSFELELSPGFYTDLDAGGAGLHAGLHLVAHPYKLPFVTPYASAGVGARGVLDFDTAEVSILFEPAVAAGAYFPGFGVDVRAMLIVAGEIDDPLQLTDDAPFLSLAAMYRF